MKILSFALLRQKALWQATGKNDVLGFLLRSDSFGGQVAGFRKDSIRQWRIAPRFPPSPKGLWRTRAAGCFTFAVVLWIFFICGASFPPSWDSRLGEASATERYVALNGTNDGTGGYITWSGASTNIQDAVNKCSDNDVVWVTNGTYYCWSNSAYAGYTSMVTVVRARDITIQSMNGPAVTIVDANYPNFTNRCFYITSNATVSGFTITNGHAKDVGPTYAGGGGVFINTSGRVTNCWITGNTTTNEMPTDNSNGGGGVRLKGGGDVVNCLIYANSSTGGFNSSGVFSYGTGGTNIIRDCIISNNYNYGASVYNVTSISISNCTFINNNGVGLYLYAAPWTVDNCRMIGNTGSGITLVTGNGIVRNCQIYNNAGGGVGMGYGAGYVQVLSNCVVSSNYSNSSGVGVDMSGNSTLVIDCTIVSNYHASTGGGGGVRLRSGTLRNCLLANNYGTYGGGLSMTVTAGNTGRVENCTIVSNCCQGGAYGGIYNDSSTATGVLFNTICYSNQYNNWRDYNAGHLAFYNSCTTPTNDLLGSNNITNAPAFVNIATRNYRLLRSSPCINTGSNMDWMIDAFDLDRHRRLDRYSGVVDMGCYEYLPRGTIYGVR